MRRVRRRLSSSQRSGRASSQQGYTLVLNVGDQWSDLKGKPEAEYLREVSDPYYFIP